MANIFAFDRLLWSVSFFLNAALVVLLLYRRNHRVFSFFFVYALVNFLQGVVLFKSYRIWGLSSATSMQIAWGTQGLVTLARALALAEICKRILGKYRGIWELVWRVLLAAAALVALYSWVASRGRWQFAILNLDRCLDLAMATVIVVLFLFARYYEVSVEPAVRTLATGFFLYSCFRVLNDTILESWLHRYATLWNLLGALAFLASMLLWHWAVRESQSEITFEPAMLSDGVYRTVMPEINFRLRALNEHLSQFWLAEAKRL